MFGRILVLSGLVALGHPKAIITNNCRKDIYIWSVPAKADLADNLSISPGKRYEEPWRSGSVVNPGIAIKVSTEDNGIYKAKSEINLQYSVDGSDPTKIWINLATVRGNDFDTATLNTCHGSYTSASVPTEQCSSTDDIELVLCGSERTVPAQDITPIFIISTCILAERDNPLHPRVCSGRVVGPKRMPMLPDEEQDEWLAEPIDTVPLKTVMRREAAKHAASQHTEAYSAPRARNTAADASEKVTEKSASPGPMCGLLHGAWPEAQCDEKMAQHNAKLFYRDNCGQRTKNMFPGTSCEAIRHHMEQIYPAIKADQDQVRMALPDVDWTSSDDTSSNKHEKRDVNTTDTQPTGATAQDINVSFTTNHSYNDVRKVCITTANEKLGKYWGAIETEQWMPQLFPRVSWTDNPDDCTPQAIAASKAYHHKLIDKKQHKEKQCVVSCAGKTCKRVKKELNKLSKDVGENWSWTDDEHICQRYTNFGPKGPKASRCLMGEAAVDRLWKYWSDDSRIMDQVFPGLDWRSDLTCDFTYDNAARTWFNQHRVAGKRIQRCVENYCKPFNADCSDVEDQLERISKNLGQNIDWTTDDDVCLAGSVRNAPQSALTDIRYGDDSPLVCKSLLGNASFEKLQKYWGKDFETLLEDNIFPDFDIEFKKDCSQEYLALSQQWVHDHPVNMGRRCVTPYCQPYNVNCSDVQNELGTMSKNMGQDIDWTTDNDVCAASAVPPASPVDPNEPDLPEYCVLAFCKTMGLSHDTCVYNLGLFQRMIYEQDKMRVNLRVDGPVCQGKKATELPPLVVPSGGLQTPIDFTATAG